MEILNKAIESLINQRESLVQSAKSVDFGQQAVFTEVQEYKNLIQEVDMRIDALLGRLENLK